MSTPNLIANNNNSNNNNNNSNSLLQPKIFPGRLNVKENKNAIDWHWQNLIAYGSHSQIVIADPHQLNILQTLCEHKHSVHVVKWSNDILDKHRQSPLTSSSTPLEQINSLSSSSSSSVINNITTANNPIRLASGDSSGTILIWNALEGIVVNYFIPQEKSAVLDMMWHPEDHTLLLALHSHHLTCWSTLSNTQVWRRSIIEFAPAKSLHIDPFQANHIFVTTGSGLVLETDEFGGALEFKLRVQSSKSGGPILMNDSISTSAATSQWNTSGTTNSALNNLQSNSSSAAAGGLSNQTEQSLKQTQLQQQSQSQSQQPINPEFIQMELSSSFRNLSYYVLQREMFIYDNLTNQQFGSLQLDRNKANFQRIILGRDNPNLMFSLHDDGSITSWTRKQEGFNTHNYEQLTSSDLSHFQKKSKKKGQSIVTIINTPLQEQSLISITGDGIIWRWDFISELTSQSNLYLERLRPLNILALNGVYKLAISGFLESCSSPITSISVYPFYNKSMTTLIAIGTSNGTIQLLNLSTLRVQRELFVWNHPVYGIKWLSPGRVICHSFEELEKNSATYSNFIASVDFRSGRIKEFRKVSGAESSFIRGIRLSYSRKFLVILLKDRPFELWETKRLVCLRSFKPFQHISGLEWLPPMIDSEVELSPDSSKYESREQFTFLLQDGLIKQCTIDSNTISVTDLQADLSTQAQSCMASKREYLVSGDASGNIHAWSLVKKKLHTISTHKGQIKKIRFNPSANSSEILVLFSSGEIGIWDLSTNQRLATSSYLMEREIKAIDIEWAQDAKPIIVSSDHSIRVLDQTLSVSNSRYQFNWTSSSSSNQQNLNSPGYLCAPLLLSQDYSIQLWHLLLNYKLTSGMKRKISASNSIDNGQQEASYQKLLGILDEKLLENLEENELSEGTLMTSQYFGDYKEIEFWRLAIHSLQRYKSFQISNIRSRETLPFYNSDLINLYSNLPGIKYDFNLLNQSNPNIPFNKDPLISPITISQPIPNIVNLNNNTNINSNNNTNINTNNLNNNSSTSNILNSNTISTTQSLLKKPLSSLFGFNLQKSTSTPNTTPSSPIKVNPPTTPITITSVNPNLNSNANNNNLTTINLSPVSRNPLSMSQSYTSVALQLQESLSLNNLNNSQDGSPLSSSSPLQRSLNDSSFLLKSTTIVSPDPQSNLISNNNGLPGYYDIYLDSNIFRMNELEKTDYHEKKKPDNQLTKRLIERNLLLGRNLKAINLLLDTTPDHPDFYNRALKASVISASISPEYYQSTTKLIAENLIAVGKLDEGVQFLCMIGKSLEACKYLQSCDKWYEAGKLAKINLNEDEQSIVFRSWVLHLLNPSSSASNSLSSTPNLSSIQQTTPSIHSCLTNSQYKALYLLLSLGDFRNVIQLLYEFQQYAMASLLILSCIENSVFNESLDHTFESSDIISIQNANLFSFKQLTQLIFKEYGNQLQQLGNTQAAEYYWIKSKKIID